MTASEIAACLFVYAVLVTVLLVVALGGNRNVVAQLKQARRNEIAANTRLARAVEHPSASVLPFERRTR